MAIKPILFNTPMVRAILNGRKSCTRRLVKPEPQGYFEVNEEPLYIYDADGNQGKITPPYQPGDILYVRETWQYLYELDGNEQIIEGTGKYYYAATDTIPFDTYVDASGVTHERVPWHPSIHMPKEAARIWLKVTDVRVERLQDMTDDDAEAEGCFDYTSIALGFPDVWDSTIKKSDLDRYGWDANPWVWVIEFERCEKPEGV